MCALIADNAWELFGVHRAIGTASAATCTMLELGSGLGRAGIMAAKIMEDEGNGGTCVLTDGEEEIVSLLQHNCNANGLFDEAKIDQSCKIKCLCEKLLWGDDSYLSDLLTRYPQGFDIVIGDTGYSIFLSSV